MDEPLRDTMASTSAGGGSARERDHAALRTRVAAILDLIRPAIQADGGDVELVEVRPDGIVVVRFHGACVGCPSSAITLQVGLERQLKERIPEVSGVEAIS